MKKQWKLDNKGMTLLEVIVAFAIFAIAATILITGFNGALKVMGNSEKIKNASQENTGKLNAVGASALEEFEGLQNSEITEKDGLLKLKFESVYEVPGTFYTATSKEKTDMDMKMFQPDGSDLVVPSVTVPKKPGEKEPDPPEDPVKIEGGKVGQRGDLFNGNSGGYKTSLGEYNIGDIEEALGFNKSAAGGKNQIRQLYFRADPSIEIGKQTDVVLDLDFVYIAGNIIVEDNDSTMTLSNDLSPKKDDNKPNVLVYFDKETTSIGNNTGIPKGYYLIPTGSDLLKITKDDFVDKYSIKKKTVSEQNQIVSDYVTNLFKGNQP